MGMGGGGGSAGKVEYPPHITTAHSDWLDNTGADTMTQSIVDLMNAAIGSSPYTALSAYDPSTPISSMISAIGDLESLVALLSSGTTLDTLISSVLDDSRVENDIDAFANQLDAQLTATVYPRFEAGMRDINAVVSSAFVIGRAVIEEGRDREVAKYGTSLRLKAFGDDAIQVIQLKMKFQLAVSQLTAEVNRMKIVALKEQTDRDADLDDLDARWDLEVYQHGANVMAAPGGGTAIPKGKGMAASMLGGALSMGAMGAMAGPALGLTAPIGLAAGALLGAASGSLG